ncbi:NAD(P)H-quinone oxidoreductase subunit U, chloroplastic [Euphorbia lathyris]|uniref:NAD(P)H-quinone oxidoreductase subunit U, chloroplastic n=1 Tax=Euphorbia lathyris TaxID=212925 RepID=UPI003313F9DA
MAMAMSSTGATFYISQQNFPLGTSKKFNSNTCAATRPRRFVLLRSSGDGSADTAATEVEEESQTYIEAPGGSPSLISALNVERALRGIPITDIDHYGRLGIKRGCSYDQVTVAYRNKVDELMNQGLDEAEVREKMESLKESYAVLSSQEERRMYDWSLGRSEKPDRYAWPYESDILNRTPDTPPFQDPENVGPTRLVGYFFLVWIVFSFVLSIAINLNP